MKVKDLYVGMLMILLRLDEVVGKDSEEAAVGTYDWSWVIFSGCLRRNIFEDFLVKVGWYIMEYLNGKLRTKIEEKKPDVKEMGSQAYETEGLQSYMQAYKEKM